MNKLADNLLFFMPWLSSAIFAFLCVFSLYSVFLFPVQPAKYILTAVAVTTDPVPGRNITFATEAFLDEEECLVNGSCYIPLLVDHDSSVGSILGKLTYMEVYPNRVVFTAEIIETPRNKWVVDLIKAGHIKDVSVGVHINKDDWKPNSPRIAKDARLLEISVVSSGAVPGAEIQSLVRAE